MTQWHLVNNSKLRLGAVILMNKFNVGPDEVEEFLKVFADTTKVFKQQPGFTSAQLHRGNVTYLCKYNN
jgi:heme-degrading monooxygenase HmoA